MSRRTKLITTAIFLVLLAIPAAYVAITWRPESPLRFHLVNQPESASSVPAKETDWVFAVSVENSSHTPIRLLLASLSWQHPTQGDIQTLGIIKPSYQEHDFTGDGDYLLIPPHASRRCTVRVQQEDGGSLPRAQSGMETSYYWFSETRGRLRDASDWLRAHTPRALHSMIPTPHADDDHTQLAPALP